MAQWDAESAGATPGTTRQHFREQVQAAKGWTDPAHQDSVFSGESSPGCAKAIGGATRARAALQLSSPKEIWTVSNTIIPDRVGMVDIEPGTFRIDNDGAARFSDHGDHPITCDHPIVGATRIPAESQLIQSGAAGGGVTLRPLHDRILVRRFPAESALGSIVLPQIAREHALRGVVVAVGPGKKDRDGVFHETMVKPGDVVLFTASVNMPYPDILQDGDLVMMAEADILGILESGERRDRVIR